jgi:hypothetical protein
MSARLLGSDTVWDEYSWDKFIVKTNLPVSSLEYCYRLIPVAGGGCGLLERISANDVIASIEE